MDDTVKRILKYTFFYFALEIMVFLLLKGGTASLTTYRNDVTALAETARYDSITSPIAYVIWIISLGFLLYNDGYEDYNRSYKLYAPTFGAIAVSTALSLLVVSTQYGKTMPTGIAYSLMYQHSMLSPLVGGCFVSGLLVASVSMILLMGAYSFGMYAFLNNYPECAAELKAKREDRRRLRRKYYSVDDEN